MTQAPNLRVLPSHLDARKMAHQGCQLEGIIPLAKLQRLNSALTRLEGEVMVDLTFTVDERSHPVVIGTVEAQVFVVCQRCMGEMPYLVKSNVHVALVAGEDQAKALPKDLDPWTVVDSSADFYHLIEEEILLALPMVAYHDHPCVEQSLFSSQEEADQGENTKVNNPFSVLEQLKGSPK